MNPPLFQHLHELDSELGRLWNELAALERDFLALRTRPQRRATTDFLRAYA